MSETSQAGSIEVPEAETAEPLLTTSGDAVSPEEVERITADLIAALKTVYDPEIPVDIYELGLIYRIEMDDDRLIRIRHDADGARLPGCRRDAGLGGKCRARC